MTGHSMFLISLIASVVFSCLFISACDAQDAAVVSTQVLNLTLDGAATGWPDDLSPLDDTVNATICTHLPTSARCNSFLMRVNSEVIALQLSALTNSSSDGSAAFNVLDSWANTEGSTPLTSLRVACQNVLSTQLSVLSQSAASLTVPCRSSSQVYTFLPACVNNTPPSVVLYARDAGGNLDNYFRGILCPTGTCDPFVAITIQQPSVTVPDTIVTLVAPSSLSAALKYVNDVRADYRLKQGVVSGPPVGDAGAGMSASMIRLAGASGFATLFSTTENNMYTVTYPQVYACQPTTNLWAIAFIAVALLYPILARYVWYRGRRHAKRLERKAIIEDERRIMQGFTNPAGDGEADVAPAQTAEEGDADAGGDTQEPQYFMGEDGNYYQMPAAPSAASATQSAHQAAKPTSSAKAASSANAATAASAAAGTAASPTYQTYTDPQTGETYQYVDDAAAAAESGTSADLGRSAMSPFNSRYIGTYNDPSTGKTYQYEMTPEEYAAEQQRQTQEANGADAAADEPTAAENAAAQAQTAAAADDGKYYAMYTDPETGETYQYEVDENGNPVAQEAAADGDADVAQGDGTTYTDPATGQVYQVKTYTDPNTGETYQYMEE